MDDYGASDLAATCLKYAFHPERSPVSRQDLSEVQLALVAALARDTNALHTDELIDSVVTSLVGENDMKKLARYLEGDQ